MFPSLPIMILWHTALTACRRNRFAEMKIACNPSACSDLAQLPPMPAAELKVLSFNVYGVTTNLITDSRAAARAVGDFLKPYRTGRVSDADIEMHLVSSGRLKLRLPVSCEGVLSDDKREGVLPLDSCEAALPDESCRGVLSDPFPAGAEPLYDWGDVRIFCRGPLRYLQIGNVIRALADLRQKKVSVILGEEEETDWRISRLLFYPLWSQLMKQKGLFALHAAGLARGGCGLLFPGRSGSGKSTLSLFLAQRGYEFLADDTLFLRPDAEAGIEAFGLKEDFSIDKSTIKLISGIGGVNLKVMESHQKVTFPVPEIFQDNYVDSFAPRLLFFPEISSSAATAIKPVPRNEALALLLRHAYLLMDPDTCHAHFKVLARLVRQTNSYRLISGYNLGQLAQALDDLIAGALKRQRGK